MNLTLSDSIEYPPHDPSRSTTTDDLGDPEITNGIRAQQAADELRSPASLRESADYSDLITNLLHLAHREGLDPQETYTSAINSFQAEAGPLVRKAIEHTPSPNSKSCTCHLKSKVTGPVPHHCNLHDGDYMTFLAMNNCD